MSKEAHWTPESGAARVLRRCDLLALCTDDAPRLTRLFASPALTRAHQLVASWMREAAMETRVDALGNLIGHRAGRDANAPLRVIGSHLDTVPDAGKYDGILGVVLGIEVVASLGGESESGQLESGVDVVGFSDEEGVRFKTPFLGSSALAGEFDAALLELRDNDGISMAEALQNFGCDGDWRAATYPAGRIAAYLEAHIEQGPVLESLGAPLGLAHAIAGQSRARARFCGQAGHAGTLPMSARRDALAAASEWILLVECVGRNTPGLVATVGVCEVKAGATNVVAGEVWCSLDVRHADDGARARALDEIREGAAAIARRRGVSCEISLQVEQPAVPLDAGLRAQMRAILGPDAPELVSGAGHDAAILARVAPAALLFLRTPGGASHCPDERVEAADVALALAAMRRWLLDA